MFIHGKLSQVKHLKETDETGKATRTTCYFIDHAAFVNVVKYKLDHVYKRLEAASQPEASSFKCFSCGKTFADLETDRLLDPQTVTFK